MLEELERAYHLGRADMVGGGPRNVSTQQGFHSGFEALLPLGSVRVDVLGGVAKGVERLERIPMQQLTSRA